MKILAIETSSKVCGVALLEDDKLIKEKILEDDNTHSVKLMPLINELLKQTNINLQDVELFACDKGPGSFTGIRIGIATIKAFLDVTGRKGIGITSLEALAYNVEQDGIICTLIDARNENVYAGFFERRDGKIQQMQALEFNSISAVIEKAKEQQKKIVFIGDASQTYQDIIKSEMKKNAIFIKDNTKNKLNAKNIALAAFYKKTQSTDTSGLRPTYLRKSNAERMLEKN